VKEVILKKRLNKSGEFFCKYEIACTDTALKQPTGY